MVCYLVVLVGERPGEGTVPLLLNIKLNNANRLRKTNCFSPYCMLSY